MKNFITILLVFICVSKSISQNIKIYVPVQKTYYSGKDMTISWEDVEMDPRGKEVNLYISYNNGFSWEEIITNHIQNETQSTNYYPWKIGVANTDKCKIKIKALYGDFGEFKSESFTIILKEYAPQENRKPLLPLEISLGLLKFSDNKSLFSTASLSLQPTIYSTQNKWGFGLIGGIQYVDPKVDYLIGVLVKYELLNVIEAYTVLTRLYLKVNGIYDFTNEGWIIEGGLQLDSYILTFSFPWLGYDFKNKYYTIKTGVGINLPSISKIF